MQTVIVTGKTFEHRELLKSYGARYNGNARNWTFKSDDPAKIEQFMSLPMPGVKMALQPLTPTPTPATKLIGIDLAEPIKACKTIMVGNCSRFHNHFKAQNPIVHFGFDSLDDLVNHVRAIPPCGSHGAWEKNDISFHGTYSMNEALNLAENGWQTGADEIAKLIEQINIDRPHNRKRSHGVTGGHVNVGRLLTGHPLHMVRRPKMPSDKIVTLFLESGARANITAQSMLLRAASAGAIVDRMEANGYRCEVVVCSNTEPNLNVNPWTFTCIVKRANERMNLHSLAFALGHPSFHRRFRFACVDHMPELQHWHYSQGRSTEGFDTTHPTRPNVEFYIPRIAENYKTIEETMHAVIPHGLPITFNKE